MLLGVNQPVVHGKGVVMPIVVCTVCKVSPCPCIGHQGEEEFICAHWCYRQTTSPKPIAVLISLNSPAIRVKAVLGKRVSNCIKDNVVKTRDCHRCMAVACKSGSRKTVPLTLMLWSPNAATKPMPSNSGQLPKSTSSLFYWNETVIAHQKTVKLQATFPIENCRHSSTPAPLPLEMSLLQSHSCG